MVIHGFPPFYMAGSEVYTYNLCQELTKNNEVYVFTRIENPYEDPYTYYDEDYHGLKVRRVNKPLRDYTLTDKYLDPKIDAVFETFLEEIKPDVVHIGHLSHLSTNLPEIARKKGCPVIYTLHDFWLKCYRGQLIKPDLQICSDPSDENCLDCVKRTFKDKWDIEDVKVYRKHMDAVISQIDLLLSPSHFLLDFYKNNGVDDKKLVFSKYGFNKSIILPKKRNYENDSKISFGFMGRVIPVKGIKILLEAFRELERSELHIFGSVGGQKVFLEKYVDENIFFDGSFDNWEINKVLEIIDVLVVPSIWYENSPLVIQEAFMAGIPVITSDIGGMAELVENGIDGFTFDTGNKDALKSIMKRIEDNPTILNGLNVSSTKVRSIQDDAAFVQELYREVL
ncbi:glycosyltransferase family 4 protein [Methanolobus profundi]|uniref:Glycosyltransferase involved in cell wall bisynthesis n=1 Tax=Methanolobus profundi TaxID=487685 RepID=A0A1I4PSB5_9EURY|nr:glycosyltransferase family 4 protein [Methanolobus profundi]SFM30761.1 Glycosyltransferase involved in cell wall bisynthesis [Methanolobus profundi]